MVDEFYFLRKSSHDTFVENWKKVEKKIIEYGTKVLKSEAAKILLIDAEEAEESYGRYISNKLCVLGACNL